MVNPAWGELKNQPCAEQILHINQGRIIIIKKTIKLIPAGKGKSPPKNLREKGKTTVTEGGTSDTLVAASNCLGQSLSLRGIYKAVNVNPRWTTGADEVFSNRHNLPMTAGDRNIYISYSSSRKAGMTPIEFKKWVEKKIS
jgi:hypothetical protein